MNFDVSYGNYDTVAAQAYVSGGLTENLAANFAVQYKNQSDGWGRNVFTGKKEYYSQDFNVRGKLLFTPGDATEITLSGNRSEEHTSELQSLMRISYAVFCLKKKNIPIIILHSHYASPKRHNNVK